MNSKIKLHPFGHIGDGNIHYNMILPNDISHENYLRLRNKIYSYVNELVEKFDGNFDLADKIRKDLLDQGIVIEDQQDKTVWKLK